MQDYKEMRAVYGETLVRLGEKNPNIMILEADLMKSSGTKIFADRFPDRAVNCGVAEANMVGIASGLSAEGKIPFVTTFGCFAARRTYDQFFVSANYARLNVKLTGSDPGIAAEYNGGTHMPFEDLGIMRTIPGLVVCEPCDQVSLAGLVEQAAEYRGCTYMRLHRKAAPPVYSAGETFELGKGRVLREGKDITIIACGAVLMSEALTAVDMLRREGVHAALIDMHTVKPVDRVLVLEYAQKTGAIVTVENHQTVNGLGSAVSEVLTDELPVYLKRIGINDEFGEVGDLDYLKKRFGLTAARIAEQAKELLQKRKRSADNKSLSAAY